MRIENISVKNSGYVECKSDFYKSSDILDSTKSYNFACGINQLSGEIDSGIWAVSYLLSMYAHHPKDIILFEEPNILVNDVYMSLKHISKYACYMVNRLDPLFSTYRSVDKIISHEIKKNKLDYSPEEIRKMFRMDAERFTRPIKEIGNERFKAMAAIGYCHGKQVFCFPWLSRHRFDTFHGHLTDLLAILEKLGVIVILPVGI